MNITEEQRDDAYQNATQRVRRLYSSPEAGGVLHSVFTDYNLSETVYKPYAIAVGDMILGLLTEEELPSVLERDASVPPKLAPLVVEDLSEKLAALTFANSAPEHAEEPTQLEESSTAEGGAASPKESGAFGEALGQEVRRQDGAAVQPLTREELRTQSEPAEQSIPAEENAAPSEEGTGTKEAPGWSHLHEEEPQNESTREQAARRDGGQSFVPRYARPFTETPRYGVDETDNPQR